MIPSTMSCREFVEFLDDYLSAALSEARRTAFDVHLSLCPPCVIYMKTYGQAVRMGRAVLERSEDELPAEIPEGLVRAILEARKKP